MKRTMKDSVSDFMAGKGFYIVLLLCVAALGVSGYYLFSGMTKAPGQTVSAPVTVVVTPKPAAKATPVPVPPSTATPRPTAAAEPTVTGEAIPRQSRDPMPRESRYPADTTTPATATASVFTWPVKGEVLRSYSIETLAYDETMGDWRTHDGVDIAAQAGAEVMAPAGGTVSDLYDDDLMGTTLVILHADGVMSVCSNLAAVPTVEIGDTVRTGDVIGSIGDTAIAESGLPSHLHLSMTKGGVSVDPLEYLPEK